MFIYRAFSFRRRLKKKWLDRLSRLLTLYHEALKDPQVPLAPILTDSSLQPTHSFTENHAWGLCDDTRDTKVLRLALVRFAWCLSFLFFSLTFQDDWHEQTKRQPEQAACQPEKTERQPAVPVREKRSPAPQPTSSSAETPTVAASEKGVARRSTLAKRRGEQAERQAAPPVATVRVQPHAKRAPTLPKVRLPRLLQMLSWQIAFVHSDRPAVGMHGGNVGCCSTVLKLTT